jgi:TPR repeat protein
MKNLICFLMLAACIALFISCEKSTDTLIKEAEQGDTKAQYTLGQIYFDSDSVQQDYTEALKWYRKAA